MNLTALSPYLRTKIDAGELSLLCGKIEDMLFKKKLSLPEILADLPYGLKQIIEKMIQEQKIAAEDKKALQSFFIKLEEELSKLPVVHLILAIRPHEELLAAMHNWFFINYKKLFLLDITYDKSLIGGAVVSFNGRANDYSLRTQIGETG